MADLGDKVRRVHVVTRRAGDTLRALLSKEAIGSVALLATLYLSFSNFAAWVSTNATLVLVMLLSVLNKSMFSEHLARTKFGEGGECAVDTMDPNLSVGVGGVRVRVGVRVGVGWSNFGWPHGSNPQMGCCYAETVPNGRGLRSVPLGPLPETLIPHPRSRTTCGWVHGVPCALLD
jgi:hypothetical protein